MPELLSVCQAGAGPEPTDAPSVAVNDLGVLRGESAFETLRVYAGRPFRLGAHLDRLFVSAEALGIDPRGLDLAALAARAVDRAGGGDMMLRLLCTKGPEDTGVPAAYALCTSVPAVLDEERRRGLTVAPLTIAADAHVRAAAPWLLPGVKATSYAVNMAAQRAARARGADEALFVALGGEVLEAPVANVLWRVGETLCTPALSLGILAGITRQAVLDAASGAGYRVEEGAWGLDALLAADEVLLTSSVREVMPVVAVTTMDATTVPAVADPASSPGSPPGSAAPGSAAPGQGVDEGAGHVPVHVIGDGRPGPAAAVLQAALRAEATGP